MYFAPVFDFAVSRLESGVSLQDVLDTIEMMYNLDIAELTDLEIALTPIAQ